MDPRTRWISVASRAANRLTQLAPTEGLPNATSLSGVRPLVRRIARQMVGSFKPGDPALGPQMKGWLGDLGIVETGGADIDEPRVVDRAPGKRGAPAAPEMAPCLRPH